ncbi:hypothetical protein [Aliiruegeria haliotis]|nr:hypothetical protein [Aliiruegeria haliotis]
MALWLSVWTMVYKGDSAYCSAKLPRPAAQVGDAIRIAGKIRVFILHIS